MTRWLKEVFSSTSGHLSTIPIQTNRHPSSPCLTHPQHGEEVEADEADDGRGQRLVDGGQVHLAVQARGQEGEVQVVFVHQVLQHQVEQAWGGTRRDTRDETRRVSVMFDT